MNKIIGFTISKNKINHDDVDIFKRNFKKFEFQKCGLNIYLWGIGDIKSCLINGRFTLSFPLSENLLDRNALITFLEKENNITLENDWLGSIPIFYNEKELIVSTFCLKTLKDKIVDCEALNNYFEFGYSVLEQTPFLDVKFLRYFSKMEINNNKITIEYKEDPIKERGLFYKREDENECLAKIKKYINDFEQITTGEIVLPTSGGYDSRLLNLLVNDKSRIMSFTFGVSRNQRESFEVVYAKKLSEKLQTKCEQVELGHYYNYIIDWFKLYGFSVHLHGMYLIEFYKKILEKYNFSKNAICLSGISGDGWSGKVEIKPVNSANELINIGYFHGNNLKKCNFLQSDKGLLKESFYKKEQESLKNEKVRLVAAMRFKLIFLSFLISLPEYFGFIVCAPFLNYEIAKSLLNIDKEIRNDRIWEKHFFIKNGVNFEDFALDIDKNNYLMYQAFLNYKFEQIDINLMGKYLKKNYLERVNVNIINKKLIPKLRNKLLASRYIRAFASRIGLMPSHIDYVVIKAIELALNYQTEYN